MRLGDHDIVQHFQSALGFIFPGMDDFGIVAVEAMAAGTPVIAYNKGGSQDFVLPGKTGLLFERQAAQSLRKVLEVALARSWDHQAIAEHAECRIAQRENPTRPGEFQPRRAAAWTI